MKSNNCFCFDIVGNDNLITNIYYNQLEYMFKLVYIIGKEIFYVFITFSTVNKSALKMKL